MGQESAPLRLFVLGAAAFAMLFGFFAIAVGWLDSDVLDAQQPGVLAPSGPGNGPAGARNH
jgi:hypothetical protein